MGYGVAALEALASLVKAIPAGGSILEYGQQRIEVGTPPAAIFNCLSSIRRNEVDARRAMERFSGDGPWYVSELFRDTPFRYRCLDVYDGEFNIVADLNIFSVPADDRATFDLITNFGTTEHVADQINAFRVMHDYASPGATMIHAVPFTGYLNHGLFNYSPLFFVLLATANEYEINYLGLSPPDMAYSIPQVPGVYGCEPWAGRVIDSGDIGCTFRKLKDQPFRLFSDVDRAVVNGIALSAPWDEMLRQRHDLRVRTA